MKLIFITFVHEPELPLAYYVFDLDLFWYRLKNHAFVSVYKSEDIKSHVVINTSQIFKVSEA